MCPPCDGVKCDLELFGHAVCHAFEFVTAKDLCYDKSPCAVYTCNRFNALEDGPLGCVLFTPGELVVHQVQ